MDRPSLGSRLSSDSATTVSSAMPASTIVELLVKHRCSDITQKLDLDRCGRAAIAGGGFGDIYQGVLHGGQKVAIKCARLYLRQSDTNGPKVIKRAARELYVWSRLKHRNVLELIGLAQFRDQLAMVSPWMDNGTLLDYIERHPGVDRCQLCLDVSEGVAYLHQYETIHGDIKSTNVLVCGEGVAKLTDFGCTELKKSTLGFTTTTNGSNFSLRWAAPEILDGKMARSKEADVYALGMTLLEIITGKVPFSKYKSDVAVSFAVAVKKQSPQRPKDFTSFDSDQAVLMWKVLLDAWAYVPSSRSNSKTVKNRIGSIKELSTYPLIATPLTSSSSLASVKSHSKGLPPQQPLRSPVHLTLGAGKQDAKDRSAPSPILRSQEDARHQLSDEADIIIRYLATQLNTSVPPQQASEQQKKKVRELEWKDGLAERELEWEQGRDKRQCATMRSTAAVKGKRRRS